MGDRTYYRLALPATLGRETIRMAAIAFTDGHWTDEDVTRLLDNAAHRCGFEWYRAQPSSLRDALGRDQAFDLVEPWLVVGAAFGDWPLGVLGDHERHAVPHRGRWWGQYAPPIGSQRLW